MLTASEKVEQRGRFCWFHWQNLNDKRDGTQGFGLRYGRCWWHFRKNRTVGLEWSFLRLTCGVGIDFDDEDVTLAVSIPMLGSLYLSLSSNWRLLRRFIPMKPLNEETYPGVIVVDERECRLKIHNGRIWLNPWSKRFETMRADPWWVRGVSMSINPFEWKFQKHEVRRADGRWEIAGGFSFLGGSVSETKDNREVLTYSYRYVLKSGEIQDRTATVHVERRSWRPRCFQWTKLFEKVRTSIDVAFSDEVGEETGSWKGGTVGCGFDLLPSETPLQSLRRMEATRKF